MVVLAIIAGTTSGAFAQRKTVRLDPIDRDLYQLTYINHGDKQVKVEVLDQDGKKLMSDLIREEKSFTKPYNFQKLDKGEYSFKITDAEGEYITKVRKTNDLYMVAKIRKIDQNRVKIYVNGDFMDPVSVNIFDRNGVLIFDDHIDQEKGFERIYDLSKIEARDLRIEVVNENDLLATAAF